MVTQKDLTREERSNNGIRENKMKQQLLSLPLSRGSSGGVAMEIVWNFSMAGRFNNLPQQTVNHWLTLTVFGGNVEL